MKLKKLSLLLTGMLALGMSSIFNQAIAQKFTKPKPVSYLQLPTHPNYASAYVYTQEEADQMNAKVGASLGKFTSKYAAKLGQKLGEKTGHDISKKELHDSFENFVKNIFNGKEKPVGKWNFYTKTYNPSKQPGAVKVVIGYLPDNLAKPMGKPMKNNKGFYTFPYRVKVQMKVFNQKNQLLLSKKFGMVSGIGHSKSWPENAKGAGGMFKVTTEKKGESKNVDPYKQACVTGAIEQCQRVLYGLYGVKHFNVPLNVAAFSKNKNSVKYKKMYDDVMQTKKSVILNSQQRKIIQECVNFWKSLEGNVKPSEEWAVHYNLALGYSWLLDANQSKQEIKKVYELNRNIFSNIENKSGSFNGKDLKILVRYNYAQPFAEYYAAGIKNNPRYVNVPSSSSNNIKLFDQAVYFIRNWNISRSLGIPLPLPLFSTNLSGKSIKKLTGTISKNGQKQENFTFEFKKGQFVNAEFNKGTKSKVGSFKSKLLSKAHLKNRNASGSGYGVPRKLNDPGDPNDFYESFNGSTANAGVKEKGNSIYYHFGTFSFPQVFMPFVMNSISEPETGGKKGGNTDMKTVFTPQGQYSQFNYHGDDNFATEFLLENYKPKEAKNVHFTISGKEMGAQFKVLSKNKRGYPTKVQATYYGKSLVFYLFAHLKHMFGYTTYQEWSLRKDFQRKNSTALFKIIADAIKNNGGKLTETSYLSHRYNVNLIKNYTIAYQFDSRGNWTEIKMGDYTVTRKIEYK